MGGSPVSGAFVVFTAPSTGASGTFASNSTNTETDTTNASGVATSSMFTANGTLGADTVTASVAGVTATTNFSLTNTSGAAASITATSGSLQDATISTRVCSTAGGYCCRQQPVPCERRVRDLHGSGDRERAAHSLSNSSATETDTTNASGVATSSTFTADATAGGYTVTATVTGVTTAANFSLTNITGAVVSITATQRNAAKRDCQRRVCRAVGRDGAMVTRTQ